MAVTNALGSFPISLERGSILNTVTGTTLALSSAYVNATSGIGLCMRFSAPVASTTITAYAYLTAKSGTVTDVRCSLYAGASGAMDDDRPDTGAAIATSAAVDVSAQANNTWTTFSLSGFTLTPGLTYWVIFHNETGTPGTNFPTYMSRGYNNAVARFNARTTSDGFSAGDGTDITNDAPFVLKFSDGSLLGNPYVKSNTHASNANDRGNRYTFPVATTVVGVYNANTAANITAIKAYEAVGGAEVASVTLDKGQINNAQSIYFDAPVTFKAGVAYDVVCKYSGSTTVGPRLDADASAPADVIACMPAGLKYVDGATPGSYTATDGFTSMLLLVDSFTGGGGGTFNSKQAVNRAGMY